MNYSPGDLADRYSILVLKKEIGLPVNDELNEIKEELKIFFRTDGVSDLFNELLKSNRKQWELEDELRTSSSLEEAGSTALKIRECNSNRVTLKNKINKILGKGYIEHKLYRSKEEL